MDKELSKADPALHCVGGEMSSKQEKAEQPLCSARQTGVMCARWWFFCLCVLKWGVFLSSLWFCVHIVESTGTQKIGRSGQAPEDTRGDWLTEVSVVMLRRLRDVHAKIQKTACNGLLSEESWQWLYCAFRGAGFHLAVLVTIRSVSLISFLSFFFLCETGVSLFVENGSHRL